MEKKFLRLKVTVPIEFEDVAGNFLIESGSKGVQIEQNHSNSRLLGYFSGKLSSRVGQDTAKYLESLKALHPAGFVYRISAQTEKNQDWSKKWRQNFKPVFLDGKVAILPGWNKKKFAYPLVIKIYPQMAFGTGTHPTTQSCLLALFRLVKPGHRVLDVGTGSGILAIAAAKRGARMVTAVDTDKGVKESLKKNIGLNQVERIVNLQLKKLTSLKMTGKYDIAVANLTGREVFDEFEPIRRLVKAGGYIIISGWTVKESPELFSFLKTRGVKVFKTERRKGWVTVICKR